MLTLQLNCKFWGPQNRWEICSNTSNASNLGALWKHLVQFLLVAVSVQNKNGPSTNLCVSGTALNNDVVPFTCQPE